MAAWFTVYCSRPVEHVTAAELLSQINRWDFHTAAEVYGIDDGEAVHRAIDSLKLEPDDGPGGVKFRLTYGRPERRPILVHVWSDQEVIEEERDEAEELLERACGQGVSQIRDRLAVMVSVVAVELGWSQLDDMGLVFAGMVSEYLATVGDGVIQDPHDAWWVMEQEVPVQIAGPE
jgi:hypothetical protein